MANHYKDDILTIHVFCSSGAQYYFYAVENSIAVEIDGEKRCWVDRNGPYTDDTFEALCRAWLKKGGDQ
jgi:hypothetical protein